MKKGVMVLTIIAFLLATTFVIALNFSNNGELIPEAGVVLLMHLNNNATDSSSEGNHGTITDADCSNSGKFLQSCNFDGNSDRITIPDDNSLDLMENFTISLWVKPNTTSTNFQALIIKGNSNSFPRAYSIYLNFDEILISWYNSGFKSFSTTAANLQTNQWYNIVYVRNSTTEEIFVNNVKKASQAIQFPMLVNTDTLRIGGATSSGTQEMFSGMIDEVVIFNKALNASEIEQLFTTPAPEPEPFCGDGIIQQESGEQCDDGNTANGDGCSSICEIELQCEKDRDRDNVCDNVDLCLNSKQGEEVDQNGCDIFQFCGKASCGLDCFSMDFKNNEPEKQFPQDCKVIIPLKNGQPSQPVCVPTVSSEMCAN